MDGSFNVTGAIMSQGGITMSGNLVAFNAPIVSRLARGGTYSKIPGTWKDI